MRKMNKWSSACALWEEVLERGCGDRWERGLQLSVEQAVVQCGCRGRVQKPGT